MGCDEATAVLRTFGGEKVHMPSARWGNEEIVGIVWTLSAFLQVAESRRQYFPS